MRLLFLCTGNSCRSQMAEGWARHLQAIEIESFSGGIERHVLTPYAMRGLHGAFVLGLAYGVLSGSCTFGFIAPILAVITVQEKFMTGLLLITIFGLGHCIPIAIAGSSAALVRRILTASSWQRAGMLFRRLAGVLIGSMGVYFMARPFVSGIF